MESKNASSFLNGSLFFDTLSSRRFADLLPESKRIALLVSYALVLLLSLVGNTYIIAIVLRNRQMHSTINYLIVNMAMSDLVSSIATILPTLSFLYFCSFEWRVIGTLGNVLCKIHRFVRGLSVSVSILSNIAIGLDRFFAIVFPMKPIPKFLKIRIVLPLIWLIAVSTFAINLFIYQLTSSYGVHMCIKRWSSSFNLDKTTSTIFQLIFIIFYFVLSLIILTFLYSIIACTLKRQKLPEQRSTEFEKRRRKENFAVIKLSLTIVTSFFIFWFPLQLFLFLELFIWNKNIPASIASSYDILIECTSIISHVNFFSNPFICFFFSSNYRKYLRKMFPFNLFF